MQIRFLQDYQGVLTGNIHFHRIGQVADLDEATARALIAEMRAEPVAIIEEGRAVAVEAPPAPQPKPAKGKAK